MNRVRQPHTLLVLGLNADLGCLPALRPRVSQPPLRIKTIVVIASCPKTMFLLLLLSLSCPNNVFESVIRTIFTTRAPIFTTPDLYQNIHFTTRACTIVCSKSKSSCLLHVTSS